MSKIINYSDASTCAADVDSFANVYRNLGFGMIFNWLNLNFAIGI